MIKGTTKEKTEINYRASSLDSSSSLKDFITDRKKYYKKYILQESVDEKENSAANMGRIVETLLMEPHLFDSKFYLSSCISTPTGLMLDFVEELYVATKKNTNEEGIIILSFAELTQEAYARSGFKIKYEAVMNKFIGSDAELYYNEIRTVRSKNLTVITSIEVSIAEKIVQELKTNPVTKDIVNLVDSPRYSILDQYQVEGYLVNGYPFKSMLDKVIVDHQEKRIIPYDLKCTWNVENFYEEYYLYRKSYIQAYLYYNAMLSLTKKEDSPFYGYTVDYLKFIVCDSGSYYSSLIYTIDESDMKDAYNGFIYKGRTYMGVKEGIEGLKWAVQTGKWNISHKNFLNNGIINIKE